ncbi:ribonuclease HI [bacterium]|nr:ribonuclease HI [bacterium]
MSDLPVIIHTDGASSGNPGPGGYGIVMQYGAHTKEFSKGFRKTTNNRMELMAVVDALKMLKRDGLQVIIYTDSKYVADAVEKNWVLAWRKKGFKGKKNPDLWREYLQAAANHKVSFKWIKGHAGHPLNERCDQLAVAAARQPEHIDSNYENGLSG